MHALKLEIDIILCRGIKASSLNTTWYNYTTIPANFGLVLECMTEAVAAIKSWGACGGKIVT